MSTGPLERGRRGRRIDGVTRRQFIIGTAAVTLLAACGGADSGSDDAAADGASDTAAPSTTRTITTPLGTYDIPADPQRVIAIDNRLDLEPAVALELPVIAYSLGEVNSWVPVGADAVEIASPVNLEEVASLRPDLIVCVNVDDEYWLAPGLDEIAPIVPTDFEVHWRTNLEQLADWLGRTERLDSLLAAYDEALAEVGARHEAAIAERRLVVVQYDPAWGFAMQHTPQYLQPQVVDDLGGLLLDPGDGVAEDGTFSMENVSVLDGADGILFVAEDGQLPEDLVGNDLWERVPAVAAGRVVITEGNTNYGSVYTATKLLEYLDELYSTIE